MIRYGKYVIVLLILTTSAACRGHPYYAGVGNFVFEMTAEITPENIDQISTITFFVHTKPGNLSKDINVTYSFAYLQQEGYVHADTGIVDVPVFGLYPEYLNNVDAIGS